MPTGEYGAGVETTIERIEASDAIYPADNSAIMEVERDLKLDGMSDTWLGKRTGHLYTIAEHRGDTRFQDTDKDGMKDLVEWVCESVFGVPEVPTIGEFNRPLCGRFGWAVCRRHSYT